MLPIVLISLLVGGVLVVIVLALAGPKNSLSDSVAAIDASSGVAHEHESSFLRRMMDEQRRHKLASRLQEAGWYNVTPAKLMFRAVIYGAVGLAIAVFLILYFHKLSFLMLGCAVVVGIFAASMPYSDLNRAIERRKRDVCRTLPDFLDMLTTTLEAGVALNGALGTTVDGLPGPLGEELRSAMQDVRLGRSRADALIAMAQRVREPDLTTVVTALVQSERLGASVSDILQQLAVESRERRMLRAEEIAATLSNKLVFPMAFCMLPALFIMIFGGVLAELLAR